MTLLRIAIKDGHYNLAAHIIVLACARALKNGGSSHSRKKHRSFYSNALDEAERIELRSAIALRPAPRIQ